MTKFIAMLSLLALGIGLMLGNFWFTYGIWPLSWFSFIAFGSAQIVWSALFKAVLSDKE